MIDFIYAETPQALVNSINNSDKKYDVISILQSKNGGYLAFLKIK